MFIFKILFALKHLHVSKMLEEHKGEGIYLNLWGKSMYLEFYINLVPWTSSYIHSKDWLIPLLSAIICREELISTIHEKFIVLICKAGKDPYKVLFVII